MTVHFYSLSVGTSILSCVINSLQDETGQTIGTPNGLDSSVPVTACIFTGDVNSSGSYNIIDALLTAQYYVGLNPAGFTVSLADTNCDNTISIVDALFIAQYNVGIINGFCEIYESITCH